MATFDGEPDVPEKRRIRYAPDEEAGNARRVMSPAAVSGGLTRRLSNSSLASVSSTRSDRERIQRLHSRSRQDLAIPIEYRTLSYGIDDERNRRTSLAGQKAAKERAKEKAVADFDDLEWHTISTEDVVQRLNTSMPYGLGTSEVQTRLKEYGRNVPTPPSSRWFSKILGYLFGGFGSVLLVAAILVFIAWRPLGDPNPSQANLALAIVLLAVFAIQATFNAWQDFSSSRVMNSITGMMPQGCLTLRGGVQVQTEAAELVPGDIIYWKAGSKLPADVRFIESSSDARFDRSILTGESAPIAAVTENTDPNYLETRNIGMQSTLCISGSGMGIVVATGDNTVFGRIAKLTSQPKTGWTSLQKEVYFFIAIIVSLMVFVNLIVLIVYGAYIRKNQPQWMPPNTVVVDVVSVAVAFIPEGLPIALTATLTIIANIMKRNNILCKSLKTVETLGAISVLCSDKTGTLTMNQMSVRSAYIGGKGMTTEEVHEIDNALSAETKPRHPIQHLRSVAAVCNAGEFDAATINEPLEKREIIGDATDQGILRFSESLGSVKEIRDMWVKRFDLAFNSKNKFMIRVSAPAQGKKDGIRTMLTADESAGFDPAKDLVMTIKGAPDVLMSRIASMVTMDGATVPFDATKRTEIEAVKDAWSNTGKRVLLLARKVLPSSACLSDPNSSAFENEIMAFARQDLVLVGLVGLEDPPRPEIPEVCDNLRTAGIRIFMVTGDFKLTAAAIARQCGIFTVPESQVHSVSNLRRTTEVTEKGSMKNSVSGSINSGSSNGADYHGALVISGTELITLSDEQWVQLTNYREIVFARTTPDQKLRIVKEFQARGNLVGMTGDGVNDAPSLKQADIGVAPGTGSDIAIEAADMVLLDSFSAIVQAVMYGRVVFDNLRKTICYLLPAGSYSELWPVFTNVIFGLPQILSSFLMIIICCFTDCAAATALAYEKPEADVMRRPPRNPKKDRLVDWRLMMQAYLGLGTIESVCSFAMAYWYAQRNGVPFSILWFGYGIYPPQYDPNQVQSVLNTASSIYFVNLVVMQWFNLMATRTRRLSIFQHPPIGKKATQNLFLFPAILFSIVIAFIFCYIPGLQNTLGSTQVPVEHWFLPVAFGVGLLSLDELRKAGVRKWPNGLLAKLAW